MRSLSGSTMASLCASNHSTGCSTSFSSGKLQLALPSKNQCPCPSASGSGNAFQSVAVRRPNRGCCSSRVRRVSVQAVLTSNPTSNLGAAADDRNARSSSEFKVLESALQETGINGAEARTVEQLKELVTVKDYMLQVQNLIKPDGGPPRWFCPINVGHYPQGAPLLLFIPGR